METPQSLVVGVQSDFRVRANSKGMKRNKYLKESQENVSKTCLKSQTTQKKPDEI